jgi:hypothetical protein
VSIFGYVRCPADNSSPSLTTPLFHDSHACRYIPFTIVTFLTLIHIIDSPFVVHRRSLVAKLIALAAQSPTPYNKVGARMHVCQKESAHLGKLVETRSIDIEMGGAEVV